MKKLKMYQIPWKLYQISWKNMAITQQNELSVPKILGLPTRDVLNTIQLW